MHPPPQPKEILILIPSPSAPLQISIVIAAAAAHRPQSSPSVVRRRTKEWTKDRCVSTPPAQPMAATRKIAEIHERGAGETSPGGAVWFCSESVNQYAQRRRSASGGCCRGTPHQGYKTLHAFEAGSKRTPPPSPGLILLGVSSYVSQAPS